MQDWPNSGLPILVQQEAKIGDGNDSLMLGRISVDKDNNMVIGCTVVSINRFAGIGMFARLSTDPLNTTRSIVPLRPGYDSYNRDVGGNIARWGDYSGLALDPVDQLSFWQFNEFAFTYPSNGGWKTSVIGYKLDETSPYLLTSKKTNKAIKKTEETAKDNKKEMKHKHKIHDKLDFK